MKATPAEDYIAGLMPGERRGIRWRARMRGFSPGRPTVWVTWHLSPNIAQRTANSRRTYHPSGPPKFEDAPQRCPVPAGQVAIGLDLVTPEARGPLRPPGQTGDRLRSWRTATCAPTARSCAVLASGTAFSRRPPGWATADPKAQSQEERRGVRGNRHKHGE